jgi:hypothetical protein
MTAMTKGSFTTPDTVRTPPLTRVEVVDLGEVKAARFQMEPGWRWSECVRPVVGTQSCQVRHVGAVVSGHLRLAHADGTEIQLGPGDAYVIEPGHDAWVDGNEPFVCHEFESATAATFAVSMP